MVYVQESAVAICVMEKATVTEQCWMIKFYWFIKTLEVNIFVLWNRCLIPSPGNCLFHVWRGKKKKKFWITVDCIIVYDRCIKLAFPKAFGVLPLWTVNFTWLSHLQVSWNHSVHVSCFSGQNIPGLLWSYRPLTYG